MAVRGPHHCDVGYNAVEPNEAVHRASLDLRLALQLQTEFLEESDRSWEVVHNNADVVHPLECHAAESLPSQRPVQAVRPFHRAGGGRHQSSGGGGHGIVAWRPGSCRVHADGRRGGSMAISITCELPSIGSISGSTEGPRTPTARSAIPGRHARLQLFEPVERDADLARSSRDPALFAIGGSDTDESAVRQYVEVTTVGRDLVLYR